MRAKIFWDSDPNQESDKLTVARASVRRATQRQGDQYFKKFRKMEQK